MNAMYVFLLGILLSIASSIAIAETDSNSSVEAVDGHGTKIKVERSHDESDGILGGHTSETKEEVVVDPEGLMNKTKESYERKVEVERDGDVSETVTSKDALGTEHTITRSKDVDSNFAGGTTATTTTKEVLDPKGLGNKQTAEIEKEVTTHVDGTKVETTLKKVNGDNVEETTKTIP